MEFANFDSQAKIGKGVVNASAAIASGGTDSMTYHTGRAAGTDGYTAVQYRWIENLWGNVFNWVDGANFLDYAMYVCTDPTKFADDTSANYTAAGITLPGSNWITGLSTGNTEWALAPDAASGGSSSTFLSDYIWSNRGWRVLGVGGYWSDGTYAGLFYFLADYLSSNAYSYIGARLQIIP